MQFGIYIYRSEADYTAGKLPTKLFYATNTSPSNEASLPSTLTVSVSSSPSVEESLDWTNVHNILIGVLQGYYPHGTWSITT